MPGGALTLKVTREAAAEGCVSCCQQQVAGITRYSCACSVGPSPFGVFAEPMRALVLRKVKAAFHFTCSHLVALTLAATALMNLVRTWMAQSAPATALVAS